MKAVQELPRVDDHGEVHEHDCKMCRNLQRQLNSTVALLESTEREGSKKTRQIHTLEKALKEAREDERLNSKRRKEVEECHKDWQQQTGFKDRMLTAARHDAIQARLNEGYTVEHIKLANTGAAKNPWPCSSKYPEPMREIATYCGNSGRHIEDYARRGARWLIEQGHDIEVPFLENRTLLEKTEDLFAKAKVWFLTDPEFPGLALTICPVCTKQMKVREEEDPAKIVFDCNTDGCTHEKIADTMRRKVGNPKPRKGKAV